MLSYLNSVRVLLVASSVAASNSVSALVLYDDSQNDVASDQAWLTYAALGGTASISAVNGVGTSLTTDQSVGAGFSNYFPVGGLKNPAFPVLDPTTGFKLSFELEIVSEAHVSNDRAGFSVILLGSDAMGIEIGFWEDEIWAQTDSPLFTHDTVEQAFFDTTDGEVLYELTIQNGNYALIADGGFLFGGAVRDYSDFAGFPNPYILPNYVFLGDDTGSAQAESIIGSISIEAIPEPSTYVLLFGLFALGVVTWKRKVR